jgi:CheY-like chemotaxis protein
MEQVFLNLAVNARDAMPNGGKLTVETRDAAVGTAEASRRHPMAPGDYVLLSVADTGQGMSPETKAHIFEPFFTTKELGKGTGLGLATVYGIIKQSDGFIWVESAIGKGTTFEIFLPRSTKAAPLSGEPQKEKPIAGGRETILAVEDEPGVRNLASDFLKAGGYHILEAAEGADALKLVNAHPGKIDILLTEMVMPGMSGAELAETLKKIRPGIRVIYMSSYAEFSDKNGERTPESARVLQKPFSRKTLLEKVREALYLAPRSPVDASKAGGPA